jgi:hypothetical protein
MSGLTATTVTTDSLVGSTSANAIIVRGEGLATTSLQQGLAKAWINFNGTGTIAARDSFNHSSLTDNGTGDYTIGLSSAMGNANYATTGGVDQRGYAVNIHFYTLATTSIRVQSDRDGIGSANYAWDWSFLTTVAQGDLA